ncbi:MAG: hypothetical protein V7K14_06595 [Nostoc sp.]|uniref:hypothetical protein n=1 Tax=Nostoc sp. TaxID=1180 RepID=UPI002FF884D7
MRPAEDPVTMWALEILVEEKNCTPVASPLALASPFGRRGDAARTSRQSRPMH